MSYYYVAGLPCSNELYHHGILGQKWGVRRFQNKDGSLTAEGRIRYGAKESTGDRIKKAASNAGRVVSRAAKSTAKNVGKAAKTTTAYASKRFKMNHPSLLTDEELKAYTQRLIQEKNMSDMLQQARSRTTFGRARNFVGNIVTLKGVRNVVGDIAKSGAKTLADAGFRKIATEMTKTKLERENDRLNQEVRQKELKDKLNPTKESGLDIAKRIMSNPNASAEDIAKANGILKNYGSAQGIMNKYFSDSGNQSTATSAESRAADFVSSVISEPAPVSNTGYRMRPLETMGELGTRPGGYTAYTRKITYDPPRTGDYDDIRFIPATRDERRRNSTYSDNWRFAY